MSTSAIWLLAALVMLCPPRLAGLQQTVRFDGRTLTLASEASRPGETVKEYIPQGQTLGAWTSLASVREYPELHDPKSAAANLVRVLKQQNPGAPSSLQEHDGSGDVIVDFVTWPPDESFVEFNVWKYRRRAAGGIEAQQYALRDYRDPKRFLRGLKPVRSRLVRLMASEGLRK